MQLLPQDLGDAWHIALVQIRATGNWSTLKRLIKGNEPEQAQRGMGPLQRFWAKGLPVSPEVAQATQPAVHEKTTKRALVNMAIWGWMPYAGILAAGSDHSLPGVLTCAAVGGVTTAQTLVWGPRRKLQRLHATPLQPDEITRFVQVQNGVKPKGPYKRMVVEMLRQLFGEEQRQIDDTVEQSYLRLVLAVMRLENVPPQTALSLRQTLRTLGEASTSLPPLPLSMSSVDVADLLADVEMLTARARREEDTVVAASFMRQAEALVSRARALRNAGTAARRTQVLRQEVQAQIAAVYDSLPSLVHGHADSTHRLNLVAETVQTITREADSILRARQELDEHAPSLADYLHTLEQDMDALNRQPNRTVDLDYELGISEVSVRRNYPASSHHDDDQTIRIGRH